MKIFAIKKEPGYFRVGYKSEVIDKAFYPVENVENTIDININHVMFPFSTKQWEYLNIRITSPEFKYKIILPNLSYEKSIFNDYNTNVIVTCHNKDENGIEHGDFTISPFHLINGQGCPKCKNKKISLTKTQPFEKTIEEIKKIYPNC